MLNYGTLYYYKLYITKLANASKRTKEQASVHIMQPHQERSDICAKQLVIRAVLISYNPLAHSFTVATLS